MTKKSSLIKEIILSFFVLASFCLFWYSLYLKFVKASEISLGQASFTSIILSSFSVIFTLFFIGLFFSLFSLFVKKYYFLFLIYLLSLVLFFFLFEIRIAYIIIHFVFLLAMSFAFYLIHDEKAVRIKVRTYKTIKAGLPIFFTFLILVATFVYYFTQAEKIKEKGLKLPASTMVILSGPLENVIAGFAPGYRKDMSVNEFLFTLMAAGKIEEIAGGADGEIPPALAEAMREEGYDPADKEEAKKALLENSRVKEKFMEIVLQEQKEGAPVEEDDFLGKITKELNLEKQGSKPILEVVYDLINKKLSEVAAPYLTYFPIIFAVFFFIGFKALSIFVAWFIYFLVWILYLILKGLGFVRVERVKKDVEVLEL